LACGLLLWSRISDDSVFLRVASIGDDASDKLTPPVLVAFSLNVLETMLVREDLEAKFDSTEEPRVNKYVLEQLVRLVSQILSRIFEIQTTKGDAGPSFDRQEQAILSMIKIMDHRRKHGQPIELVDLELLSTISISKSESLQDDNILLQLWRIYQRKVQERTKIQSSGIKHYLNSRDDQLMIDTLRALLDQTSLWPESESEIDQLWQDKLFFLIQEKGAKSKHLPQFWGAAIEWWLSFPQEKDAKTKLSNLQSARTQWVWLLLHSIESRTDDSLLLSEKQWEQLLQLLLAAVVTTADEITTLRPLAWTVACRNWRRVLKMIGLDRHVCSLLRLAVGEWKIQLESIIRSAEDGTFSEKYGSSTGDVGDSNLQVLLACGQMVTQTVVWITDLDELLDNASPSNPVHLKPKCMTKSSIKHITQSLEQALDLCVQFFQVNISTADSLDQATETVTTVFGTLLTEFDVFTGSSQQNMDEDRSKSLVQALDQAMTASSNNMQLSCRLFPAITTVLASAQGIQERIAIAQSLTDNTLALVDNFWDESDDSYESDWFDLNSIIWVCQLMELLFDICPAKVNRPFWKAMLIEFLKRQESGNRSASRSVLETAVACFVTLQGNQPPSNEESLVIEKILARFHS